jgi:predicted acylesterase/phospholipase RssA
MRFRIPLFMLVAVALAGCTGVRLPPALATTTEAKSLIPGYQDIRAWGDVAPQDGQAQLATIRNQILARAERERGLPNGGIYDVLVLSGGGSDGAYGAGLLNGWTRHGDRPEFQLVTGISTGALIAPFAFLGPDYDEELERFYTTTRTADLIELNVLRALFGWALGLTDITLMQVTVDNVLTDEMIGHIAAEHAKGRRLWIGTTNLDAQRPVIWDIGAIASSDRPNKRELIRDVLLASSAIPGALPPVLFTVEVDGEQFSEMHVDGGVTRQLFVYPRQWRLDEQLAQRVNGITLGTIYVVRNTRLDPVNAPVRPNLLDITQRSISTLIKAAGVADIQVIEDQANRDGWALRVTAVPASFDQVENEFFDPDYMRALFDVGYERALAGDPWETVLGPGGVRVRSPERMPPPG